MPLIRKPTSIIQKDQWPPPESEFKEMKKTKTKIISKHCPLLRVNLWVIIAWIKVINLFFANDFAIVINKYKIFLKPTIKGETVFCPFLHLS